MSTAIHLLTDQSELYPPLLREIAQPPRELYVRGNVKRLSQAPLLAVVGSRKASAYGKRAAEKVLPPLIDAGVIIVSGLAFGIDSLAHRLCLAAGRPTIAVLGSGVDDQSIYPKAHISLAHQIIAGGGTVVSEYPPGMAGFPQYFPARNRIIAGLSGAVLIVQAARQSGSLITAKLALDANRDVGAIPGAITDPLAYGTNDLIRHGATPVLEPRDLFLMLDLPEPAAPPRRRLALTETQRQVLAALGNGPTATEVLLVKTGLPSPVLAVTMTELELLNLVAPAGGAAYMRKEVTAHATESDAQ